MTGPRPTGFLRVAFLSLLLPGASRAAELLTFDEAVRLATERNERGLAADERAASAEARVRRAKAFFFPTVSAEATATWRGYSNVSTVGEEQIATTRRDAFAARLFANQVLLDLRAIPLWRQAKSDRDAARLEAVNERRLVGFDAASAFLTTLGLEEAAAAAQRRLDLAKSSLRDAEARFEAGLVSSNDVTRARLEAASAERDETSASGAVAEARLNLGFLVDERIEGPLAPPEPLLDPERDVPASPEALVTEAVPRRPDVAARRKRAEALRFFAEEPMKRYFPSLNLTGDARFNNESPFAGQETTWTLGVSLGWTLFDGLARQADRADRSAQARAAELDEKLRERQVDVDVRSALVALGNARAAIRHASVASEVARKNASETAELYRQGLSTALAVADANVRLFEADVALARERFGLGQARLALSAALGLDPLGKETK